MVQRSDSDNSAAAATTTEKNLCAICETTKVSLEIDDNTWICETCAQIMSEAGHEISLE